MQKPENPSPFIRLKKRTKKLGSLFLIAIRKKREDQGVWTAMFVVLSELQKPTI